MKKSKGQTLVFEQVLIFTMGVVILIAMYALFVMYQNFYTSATMSDHARQVKEYIASAVLELSKYDFNSSSVIEIPERIGGYIYKVELSNAGINITFVGKEFSDFSHIFNLGDIYELSGTAVSESGKIVIEKRGNKIRLR